MPAPPPRYADRHPDLGSRMGRSYDRYQTRVGRWLVYLRSDRRFPCECFNPATQSARESDCPLCFGTGHKTQCERMRGFLSAPENISSLVTTVNIGDWGRLDQYPGVLYIPRGYFPTQFDLVIECEWDLPPASVALYGRPTTLLRAWKISTLIPVVFNDSSSVDYYLAGLEQHSLEIDLLRPAIQSATLLPPQRGSLPGGQSQSEAFTPDGGNTGSFAPQVDAPLSTRPSLRGLGRASRRTPPGA